MIGNGPSTRQHMAVGRGKINPAGGGRQFVRVCGRSRLREASHARAAVTQAIQGVRMEPVQSGLPPFGDTFTFRRYIHMAIKFGRPIEMRDAPRRDVLLPGPGLDLVVRPRRNRKAAWARPLAPENVLTPAPLLCPRFFTTVPTPPHT